jgi:hypothetical protein
MAGRLFDDRGNRMSPTHANKRGVRYRYYVSHALLQNRPRASPRDRDPVCEGVRRHLATTSGAELSAAHADRELIERHVACVIIKPQALEVCLIPMCEAVARTEDPTSDASAQTEDPGLHDQAPCRHASLDRVKLSGREGHCASALRKTDDEGRDPRGAACRNRQS